MKEIDERRSVRSYQNKEVEEEKLIAVLNAGRVAPSARNRQMWHFYVIKNPDIKKEITALSRNQEMIEQAPICIVVSATDDYMMSCKIPAYVVDPTLALANIMLEARYQGLGTCWIGSFDQDALKALLKLPEEETIIGLTPLGYPNETPRERNYKSIDEIVTYID